MPRPLQPGHLSHAPIKRTSDERDNQRKCCRVVHPVLEPDDELPLRSRPALLGCPDEAVLIGGRVVLHDSHAADAHPTDRRAARSVELLVARPTVEDVATVVAEY